MRFTILSDDALREIKMAVKYANAANHRVAVVLTGSSDSKLVAGAVEVITAAAHHMRSRGKIIYVYHAFYEDGCARQRMFQEALGMEDAEYIPYHESIKVLGRTFSVAVLDLINNLEPNDIGRLSGIVEGGGLYVFIMPRFEDFDKIITRFQSMLVTPQYGPERIRRFFERRFVAKLMEYNGIIVYDVDRGVLVKRSGLPARCHRRQRPPISIPEKRLFHEALYRTALTQDQVNVLSILETLYKRPEMDRKKVVIITSDRGRGKSSAIGIGIAGLAHKIRRAKGRCRVIVTAPSEANVQEIFRFAARCLERFRYRPVLEEREGFVVSLKAKGIEVLYVTPLEALSRSGEILVVDEAASLQVPMLFALLKRFSRVIYSSTIHGYEGAGRGFSVRFMNNLRSLSNVDVQEYEMSEPIRYAQDDPVEKWVFDTLLLDAEPPKLGNADLKLIEEGKVQYYRPALEEFFTNEELLRQFFGIYVMAHYRNNPNDLGMMMDAPHHFPRALILDSGKVVVSLELAEEGPLDEKLAMESARGAWIMGNIIPDRLIKYYKLVDFGRLKGVRIVRIATHPRAWGRGLGSRALAELEREAREGGYDWLGAGFGVSRELLNFWLKNGYTPVHLSPSRNPVSGEYSLLVVKPLTRRAARYIRLMSSEFKRRLLHSLAEPYHDLDPEIARMLLKATLPVKIAPKLTRYQLGRFMSYAWGDMTLENSIDVMSELARVYFMRNHSFLTERQELLLIAKVLQAKSWRLTCSELGLTPPQAIEEARMTARKISEVMYGIGSAEEAEPLLYLKLE